MWTPQDEGGVRRSAQGHRAAEARAQPRRPRRCAAPNGRLRAVGAHCGRFFDSSSMHGLKYLAEPRRPWHERLLWLLGISLAAGACAVLVGQTWQRWRAAPIIVALDERSWPVWEIPFPAVTLCPVNKINATKFNLNDVYRRALRGNVSAQEKSIISQILLLCSIHNDNLTSSEGTHILDLIEKFAPDLDETILLPKYRRDPAPRAFQPILTEEGICYSFNMIEGSHFFSNGTVHLSRNYLNYGKSTTEWTMADGYVDTAGRDTYPLRTVATGEDSGLSFTVALPLCDMDAACRDALEGHTVTLHSPIEFPRPHESALRLPLAGGAKVSVRPLLLSTDHELKGGYSVEQRRCFFPEERQLAFFRHYTQAACELECLSNFTLKRCGCVPFHMPRFVYTNVCGSSYHHQMCVRTAKDEFQEVNFSLPAPRRRWALSSAQAPEEPRGERDRCRCLQNCVYIAYDGAVSSFESQSAQWLNRIHKEKCNDESYEEKTTLETVVSIYFENGYIIPLRRMERFGTVDFLANCGGLLGLCLGVSALSIIEFLYWLLVRPWCRHPGTTANTNSP